MSDILIKGMEMPLLYKTYKVRFAETNVGKIVVVIANEGSIAYMPVGEAVSVPPHGRLIDADALITTFCEWGTRLERGRKFVITMSEAKQAIVDIVVDAPTIIPAEEGET